MPQRIIGSRLDDGALGAVRELTPELREKLTEPGSIVIDESELSRLGINGVGDTAEIAGHRVRVVGLVQGLRSLAGPYVFCSVTTARPLLRMFPDQTIYVLGRCKDRAEAAAVVEQMRNYPKQTAFVSEDFSLRSRAASITQRIASVWRRLERTSTGTW